MNFREQFKVTATKLFQRYKEIPLQDFNESFMIEDYYVSEKLDGVFGCVYKDTEGKVRIISRTGEEYLSVEHLKPHLERLINDGEFLICELYHPMYDQPTISGWCRDTVNQRTMLQVFLFGLEGNSNDFETNINELHRRYVEGNFDDVHDVWLLPQLQLTSIEELKTFIASVYDNGGEGVVLRKKTAKYKHGSKTNNIIKIKRTKTYDLEVVGIVEGKKGSKYVGMVGALKVKWKDGKTINVSGMTDYQRNLWWDKPEEIIGKIIEVRGMMDSTKGSIVQPRFKSIRYDKTEGDF